MVHDMEERTEVVTLGELFRLLWDGKIAIAIIAFAVVLLSLAAYLVIPSTYRTSAEILPLRPSEFSNYFPIADEQIFPHRPETMLASFAQSARDTEVIEQSAEASGLLTTTDENRDQHVVLRDLLNRLTFEPATTESALNSFQISLETRHPEASIAFMDEYLSLSSQSTAVQLAAGVEGLLAARRTAADLEATRVQVEVEALRQRLAAQRADRIARLAEQAAIAHALGLERSPEQRFVEVGLAGQLIIPPERDSYQNGYAALEAQIDQIKTPDASDLVNNQLRELQERLYVLQSGRVAQEIRSRLALTPLAEPATAQIVRYRTAALDSVLIFPRLGPFLAGGVAAGLLLGVAFVVGRRLVSPKSSQPHL